MLHQSVIHHIMERRDASHIPVPFAVQFVKKTGEIVDVAECVCTSSFHQGTFNIKILVSGEIRKIRKTSILKVNNQSVYW